MRAITHSRRLSGWVISVLAAVLLVFGGIVGYFYATRDTSVVPKEIKAQLDFTPMVLGTSTGQFTVTDYKSSMAEDNVKILSYVVHAPYGIDVTVSQYTQPTEFSDIPEYKDRFLTNVAKQYETAQTRNGTVYLGRMAKQDNKQLAVMIEKGLIVFMNPTSEMNADQWRELVNKLDLEKED